MTRHVVVCAIPYQRLTVFLMILASPSPPLPLTSIVLSPHQLGTVCEEKQRIVCSTVRYIVVTYTHPLHLHIITAHTACEPSIKTSLKRNK